MEYKVIRTDNDTELEQIVMQHLKDGWICQGGVAIVCREHTDRKGYTEEVWTYAQAMVRSERVSGYLRIGGYTAS